jgi:cell division protein FtsL
MSARRTALPGATGGLRLAELAAAALLVAALGVFHVWSRTRVLAAGYALGELQQQHAELISAHDRLRIEVEMLRSPRELERYARAKLGMAPPAPGAVLAAGPGRRFDGAGRAGGNGVGHPPGPAEPSLSTRAAGPAADPGALALRGPLRAGRAPPREP